jgi:hypothetical protein
VAVALAGALLAGWEAGKAAAEPPIGGCVSYCRELLGPRASPGAFGACVTDCQACARCFHQYEGALAVGDARSGDDDEACVAAGCARQSGMAFQECQARCSRDTGPGRVPDGRRRGVRTCHIEGGCVGGRTARPGALVLERTPCGHQGVLCPHRGRDRVTHPGAAAPTGARQASHDFFCEAAACKSYVNSGA